jgi:hypothetical protein
VPVRPGHSGCGASSYRRYPLISYSHRREPEGVGATARRLAFNGEALGRGREVAGTRLSGRSVDRGRSPAPDPVPGMTAVYARVSSADQRADLDRQMARVTAWATQQGYRIDQVVAEVGSVLNGKRRRFLAFLRDAGVTTILVEHQDRFARFGPEGVEAALEATGRRLVVVDPSEIMMTLSAT